MSSLGDISNCEYIHEEIVKELENRYVLHWNFRGLNELPVELLYFGKHLGELYLKWNNLCTLPDWIYKLNVLTNVYLFGNEIEYLPTNIGLLKLLSVLELQNNFLTGIPSTIGNLKNLSILNLQFNRISELPQEIKDLKALVYLNVQGNKLRALPPTLFGLNSLQELILDQNFLTELPPDIVYLPNLSYVSLNGNLIYYLPFQRFISNPTISFVHNPEINYLSYDMGCALTGKSDLIIEGSLWHFDITGCGSQDIKPERRNNNIILLVPCCEKIIALPETIKHISSDEDFRVPSLFELCLRTFHDICFDITDIRSCIFPEIVNELPNTVQKLIKDGPVSRCHYCKIPVFTECLLWLIPRFLLNIRDNLPSKLISILLFCSRNCSKEFIHYENLTITISDKLGISKMPWKILIE